MDLYFVSGASVSRDSNDETPNKDAEVKVKLFLQEFSAQAAKDAVKEAVKHIGEDWRSLLVIA